MKSKKLSEKQKRNNLFNTAYDCIEYVGFANYAEREKMAKQCLDESFKTGRFIPCE